MERQLGDATVHQMLKYHRERVATNIDLIVRLQAEVRADITEALSRLSRMQRRDSRSERW